MYETVLSDNKIITVEDGAYELNNMELNVNNPQVIQELSSGNQTIIPNSYTNSNTVSSQTTGLFGTVKVKEQLISDSFVPGVSGWKINGLGDVEFNNGKFRGDISGSTGTFSGAVKSGKTSFTDSTNAGWYLGPEGVYVGAALDSTKMKFNISDGSFEMLGKLTTGTGSSINGTYISNATITGDKIANATITGSNIGSGTITGSNISSATITGANIGSATITGSNISNATITSTQIANATITGTQIANSTILAGNIANGTITSTQISSTAGIVGGQISSATITGGNIAATTVTAANIANLTITSGQIANLTISSDKVKTGLMAYSHNIIFSATNDTKVSWASGTLTTSDGTSYSISAGDTGIMSAKTYIYLDIAVSTTTLQTTTTFSSAIGDAKMLIAVAENHTGEAIFQVFNGIGGLNIAGSSIVTGTITANEIAANTITASQIAANTITASQIAAGTITATELNSSLVYAGSITVAAGGNIKGGQTAYNTGTGFWLGDDSGTYKFSLGNPSGNYLKWDGTNLNMSGSITASTGYIGGTTNGFVITSGKLYSIGTGYIASDNNAIPYAKLDSNGITLYPATSSQGLTILNSTGAVKAGIFSGTTTESDLGLFSSKDIVLWTGANGSVMPYTSTTSYLGTNTDKWAGLYLSPGTRQTYGTGWKSTESSSTSTDSSGSGTTSGPSSTYSGLADGPGTHDHTINHTHTTPNHSHSVNSHSHALNLGYIVLNINGTNYNIVTAN